LCIYTLAAPRTGRPYVSCGKFKELFKRELGLMTGDWGPFHDQVKLIKDDVQYLVGLCVMI